MRVLQKLEMRRAKIATTLLFLSISIVLFQNCEVFGKKTSQAVGGEGYGGKVYAHYGVCADDKIQVKTLIQKGIDGSLQIIRRDCQDLPTPEPVTGNVEASSDPNLFVYGEQIFDFQAPLLSETKLTTAYCHSDDRSLEATVWYRGTVFEQNPDPRLATELFGQVRLPDGRVIGTIDVAPPVVYTDKLVYVSKSTSDGFELTQTRNGVGSKLTFLVDGTSRSEVVSCYRQAAPEFLESNVGYFLRLLEPLANGREPFALLSHDTTSYSEPHDVFKRADESAPVKTPNSDVGWKAGYANIDGVVYEMRKDPVSSRVCFGPGDDPRASCLIDVIGKVNSDEFKTLYEAALARGSNNLLKLSRYRPLLTKNEFMPMVPQRRIDAYYRACPDGEFPGYLNWGIMAVLIERASRNLIFLNDPDKHAALRQEILRSVDALLAVLPSDIFKTQGAESCRGADTMTANSVMRGLDMAFQATKYEKILPYIVSKKFDVEALLSRNEDLVRIQTFASGLLVVTSVIAKFDTEPVDAKLLADLLDSTVKRQLIDPHKQRCSDGREWGGWFEPNVDICVSRAGFDAVQILADLSVLDYLLQSKGCEAGSVLAGSCAKAIRSIHGAVAYMYNNSDVVLGSDSVQNYRFAPSIFAQLIGATHRAGVRDETPIRLTFDPTRTVPFSVIKAKAVEYNSAYRDDEVPDQMPEYMMFTRLAELQVRGL